MRVLGQSAIFITIIAGAYLSARCVSPLLPSARESAPDHRPGRDARIAREESGRAWRYGSSFDPMTDTTTQIAELRDISGDMLPAKLIVNDGPKEDLVVLVLGGVVPRPNCFWRVCEVTVRFGDDEPNTVKTFLNDKGEIVFKNPDKWIESFKGEQRRLLIGVPLSGDDALYEFQIGGLELEEASPTAGSAP